VISNIFQFQLQNFPFPEEPELSDEEDPAEDEDATVLVQTSFLTMTVSLLHSSEATFLHCLVGPMLQTFLGTFLHFCLGTCSHSFLGTLWHSWLVLLLGDVHAALLAPALPHMHVVAHDLSVAVLSSSAAAIVTTLPFLHDLELFSDLDGLRECARCRRGGGSSPMSWSASSRARPHSSCRLQTRSF